MFFKGMSFGFMAKNGWYSSPAGKAEVQHLIHSGADSVALMVTIMQDSFASTRMYRDFEITPSDDEVIETIRAFRQAGIKVMLKPIIEHHDSTHRCEINFPEHQEQIAGVVTDYWGEWFRNYTFAMLHYARICEQEGVEMLLLGCEMTGADKREQYWPPMIEKVRKVYHGLLSYNTPSWGDYNVKQNWIRKWFLLLDMVGVSNYYGVPTPEPNAEKVADFMKLVVDNLEEASKLMNNMPIFMAEYGVRSVQGALERPSDCWRNQNGFDGQIQIDYLDGCNRAFSGRSWWAGGFWWKWDEQQNRPYFHHTTGDTGFMIAGKPAEKFFHDMVTPLK